MRRRTVSPGSGLEETLDNPFLVPPSNKVPNHKNRDHELPQRRRHRLQPQRVHDDAPRNATLDGMVD